MLHVRAVKQTRQSTNQADAADGSPANDFNRSVSSIGTRCDHHFAAGEFAVVEAKKEIPAAVPSRITVASERKRPAAKGHERNENAQQIAKFAKRLENAIAESSNVGGEPDACQVNRVNFARIVSEANDIAWPRTAIE